MNPKYAVLQKIKNGKRVYAITPRIPGGFISANQMIKIAEIAKKYNASIKLTSGQRVSLIGLKAEDVEKAWQDLGMDPGVLSAYSVKNVEICPGEICKRARQKSLGLGMRLEKRFYGAPAPNRTKIGVIACLNGCTSLHAKDIGVLADEEGFIVVAGGSAGFHQRLSDEIKRNLTEDEAFVLVESLFDYYCENAEAGEKLGHFMDRIGVEKFREEVLKIFEERMKGSDNIE